MINCVGKKIRRERKRVRRTYERKNIYVFVVWMCGVCISLVDTNGMRKRGDERGKNSPI